MTMYVIEFMFEPHKKHVADAMLNAINLHHPIESGIHEQKELVNFQYGAVFRYVVWSTWEDDSMLKELKRIKSIITNAH